MIAVAAQQRHAARQHLFGIDAGHFEAEHLGVEFRRPLEVADLRDPMADFGDVKFHAFGRRQIL